MKIISSIARISEFDGGGLASFYECQDCKRPADMNKSCGKSSQDATPHLTQKKISHAESAIMARITPERVLRKASIKIKNYHVVCSTFNPL